jgi:DNA-binding CsgD family transcriptional regulator
MIKERCKKCDRIYKGEECPCATGRRYRELKCDCGEPAVEVYRDRLGEWPFCSVCLKRYLEPDGEELLPDHNAQEQKDGEAGAREYPFALTRRQYEIARLSPKSDKEIGEKLSISPSTVNAHLRVIFKKLGVQSRHEIRHVLSRAEDGPARPDDMGLEVDGDTDEPGQPATVTLTISKRVYRFGDIRDFIRQIGSLLDRP